MKYIIIGKIVNTHGIKGEVRILSDFPYKSKVFKTGMKIYIGKIKEEKEITSYRHHKIFDMITMKGITNINEVLKYKGEYVFINKEDLILADKEYLDEDLIGKTVIMNGKNIGKVKKILRYNKNNLFLVNNGEKDFYIPYNFDIIENINLKNGEITIKQLEGLIK